MWPKKNGSAKAHELSPPGDFFEPTEGHDAGDDDRAHRIHGVAHCEAQPQLITYCSKQPFLDSKSLVDPLDHEQEAHGPQAAARKGRPDHRMLHRLLPEPCEGTVEEVNRGGGEPSAQALRQDHHRGLHLRMLQAIERSGHALHSRQASSHDG